jgi:hypothetical protein
MALSIKVAPVSYRNFDPGINGTGCFKKVGTQGSVYLDKMLAKLSFSWPVFIVSKCSTVIAKKLALGSVGDIPGKRECTFSSRLNTPSVTAKPTAVLVKLFDSEYNVWT